MQSRWISFGISLLFPLLFLFLRFRTKVIERWALSLARTTCRYLGVDYIILLRLGNPFTLKVEHVRWETFKLTSLSCYKLTEQLYLLSFFETLVSLYDGAIITFLDGLAPYISLLYIM